jgi:hypothetical protein
MPLKCACGCGQDINDGAPYVGVPLGDGSGNYISFIPEHHQGVQADFTKSVTQPEPVYADNPLTTKEEREIKAKAREHYRKSAKVRKAKTGPEAQMLQKGVDIGMSLAYDDIALGYGKFAQMAKGRRRKKNPCGRRRRRLKKNPDYKALYEAGKKVEKKTKIPMSGASLIGKVAGKKAEKETVKAALGATGKNPVFNPELVMASGYRCPICKKIYPYTKRGRTAVLRCASSHPRKNSRPGFIATHNAQVTEVRYREFGTGERFKHKLVRPVRMKKRGSRIIIPPMKVKPEGITQ